MSTIVEPLAADEVRRSVVEHFEQLIADNEKRTAGLRVVSEYVRNMPDNHHDLQKLATTPGMRCDCCGDLLLPISDGIPLYDLSPDSPGIASEWMYVFDTIYRAEDLTIANRWFAEWVEYVIFLQSDDEDEDPSG